MNVRKIRRKRKDGSVVLSAKWYIDFKDHRDAWRSVPAYKDRASSNELQRKLGQLVEARSSGTPLEGDIARWLERSPLSMRRKLHKMDLVDPRAVAGSKSLDQHLDDLHGALQDQGRTKVHADQVAGRARHVFAGCGFKVWNDIRPSAVERFIADMRRGRAPRPDKRTGGINVQTANHYLRNCKQFCNWMIRDLRAETNPLACLKQQNPETDRRRVRRALSLEEVQWLLKTTVDGDTLYTISGKERAAVYWLALETGLRLSEIRSLRRRDLDLDPQEPTVTCSAKATKNRQTTRLPLRAQLAAFLGELLANKLPDAAAFKVTRHGARMVRGDLEAARRAWIDEASTPEDREDRERSGFLTYIDDAGEVADFHGLRHSFITNLARGGVHPRTAQKLARHSTIELTMGRYTHTLLEDLRGGVAALPAITARPRERAAATGTDGRPVPKTASAHARAHSAGDNEVVSTDMQDAVCVRKNAVSGAETSAQEAFKTGAFNHSATPPAFMISKTDMNREPLHNHGIDYVKVVSRR